MEKDAKANWLGLFGQLKKIPAPAVNPAEGTRESFGKNIVKIIKECRKTLKSKNLNGSMRSSVQEILDVAIRGAKLDVSNLECIQSSAIRDYWAIRDEEVKQSMREIISRLDRLILRQAKIMRTIHCPIQVETSAALEKKTISKFYDVVTESINKGDYAEALESLLGYHYIIDAQNAKRIDAISEEAAKHYPKNAEDFLSVLKVRLFAQPNSPETINYNSTLKNNSFLEDPRIKAVITNDYEVMSVTALLEELIETQKNILETKLKEQYKNGIVKECDALLGLLLNAQRPPLGV